MPMVLTNIYWHDFKTEGPPSNSRQVLITDGKQLGTAHFFHKTYGPPDYKEAEICMEFHNQHGRILGEYIPTKQVTHWADPEVDLKLPIVQKGKKKHHG